MSALPIVPGKLRLKGAAPASGKRKKKLTEQAVQQVAADVEEAPAAAAPAEEEAEKKIKPMSDVPLTKAELNFLLVQAKKEKELIKKAVSKTHRERIEEFNQRLANLSEHYDIPKVGPG